MRILILMTHLSPWSRPVAVTLQSLGHEVHVVDFATNPGEGPISAKVPGIVSDFERSREQVAGIHLLGSPVLNNLRYPLAAPRLRRLARQLGTEMVLTLYGGGFALMAYLSGFRPFCVYVVGSDVLRASPLARRVNRRTLSAASRVFANGAFLAMRTRQQVTDARVVELLMGADMSLFEAADLSSRPIRVICTRGFHHVYNNASLVRALAMLPEDLPDFRVVFTSAGMLLEETRALADRVLAPAQRSRVEFWGGVSYDRIVSALRASHLYVSMSRSDGTATSLLEALGTGLFPILSDIPQNREWVDPRLDNGMLVPLDDDHALAAALATSIREPARWAAASEANRRLARERADSATNLERLSAHLEEALAESQRNPR